MDDFEMSEDEADRFWEWAKSSGEIAALTAMLLSAPDDPLPGRNDPCWCGSGKKYKKCCLNDAGIVPDPQYLPAPKPAVLKTGKPGIGSILGMMLASGLLDGKRHI